MSTQPDWELIGNMGDASADSGNLDYGAYYVYRDKTSTYAPEAEFIEEPGDWQWSSDGWDAEARWTVYRFILEPCTYRNDILSDNLYHPEIPAWFADSLPDIARTIGAVWPNGQDDATGETIILALCSDNPLERAAGYREIGEYHGFDNLDSYPLRLTEAEVKERYGAIRISR